MPYQFCHQVADDKSWCHLHAAQCTDGDWHTPTAKAVGSFVPTCCADCGINKGCLQLRVLHPLLQRSMSQPWEYLLQRWHRDHDGFYTYGNTNRERSNLWTSAFVRKSGKSVSSVANARSSQLACHAFSLATASWAWTHRKPDRRLYVPKDVSGSVEVQILKERKVKLSDELQSEFPVVILALSLNLAVCPSRVFASTLAIVTAPHLLRHPTIGLFYLFGRLLIESRRLVFRAIGTNEKVLDEGFGGVRVFLSVSPLVNNVLPVSMPRKREKSRLFRRKVL